MSAAAPTTRGDHAAASTGSTRAAPAEPGETVEEPTSTAEDERTIVLPALQEDFRSAVLSGLLLHLCPPSGQFADLFGLEEVLRWRVLAVLGAKDLATFGVVSF